MSQSEAVSMQRLPLEERPLVALSRASLWRQLFFA
jgi:hypothetical protein